MYFYYFVSSIWFINNWHFAKPEIDIYLSEYSVAIGFKIASNTASGVNSVIQRVQRTLLKVQWINSRFNEALDNLESGYCVPSQHEDRIYVKKNDVS